MQNVKLSLGTFCFGENAAHILNKKYDRDTKRNKNHGFKILRNGQNITFKSIKR
jgi:hypothetical protein